MAHIQEDVRKREKLSKKEAKRLEGMLDEIEQANPSMPPEIYPADETLSIDTSQGGGQSIDGHVIGDKGMKELRKLVDKFNGASRNEEAREEAQEAIFDLIGDYLEGKGQIYEVEIVAGGWIAHLSMPGYMDQTEPQHFGTLAEAIESLHEQFADNG